jgi:excisionase family DNA binding protein|nr:excisionase [uncultured Oscillibacter sp.]
MESKNPLYVPIWEKYTLSIEEAAKYFRIGEKKLRRMAEENPAPQWALYNGSHLQIKRKILEQVIDDLHSI